MATIQVRIDDTLKAQADALFSDIGLDTPTAIRIFLKKAVSHDGIPFSLTREPQYNAETLAVLRDVQQGRELHGPFKTVDALMEDLNAES